MAVKVKGLKTIKQEFEGDGICFHVGFKAKASNKSSLTNGEGRMFMVDVVRDSEGNYHPRKDGVDTFEADLQPLLDRTYTNGVSGWVALQIVSEVADLMRTGAVENIHGVPDVE